MIERTIYKQIELSVKSKPITLITSVRQVGKSSLALLFVKKGFNYVILDNSRERELAKKDPILFLSIHPWPLIIDEVQYAKELFSALEELFNNIVKGMYPELYSNELLNTEKFYSDYVETHIERDVSEIINIKDKFLFRNFMELLASLTGCELVYDNLAKIISVDKKTIMSWISVLLAFDNIYLLEPYNEISFAKRIVKRPKIYFSDTGLACYLAKLSNS